MTRRPTYERSRRGWPENERPLSTFEYDEEAGVARAAAEDARRIHGLCTRLVATIEDRQRQSESGASESGASDVE